MHNIRSLYNFTIKVHLCRMSIKETPLSPLSAIHLSLARQRVTYGLRCRQLWVFVLTGSQDLHLRLAFWMTACPTRLWIPVNLDLGHICFVSFCWLKAWPLAVDYSLRFFSLSLSQGDCVAPLCGFGRHWARLRPAEIIFLAWVPSSYFSPSLRSLVCSLSIPVIDPRHEAQMGPSGAKEQRQHPPLLQSVWGGAHSFQWSVCCSLLSCWLTPSDTRLPSLIEVANVTPSVFIGTFDS